ncbi:APC family permease [Plantactinospora sp. KLBMP9567]|uniref:APC family permease n=1 Tax=Plantactinospora sp. KLBMP9567 TaxID=3085900 RepID=UPI0029816A34|nr:APC family permease [Plantactinospora sp. KLBMP9567]MDW5323693.1 APC family permease [Plantactinospora sp. KLBMP9567]
MTSLTRQRDPVVPDLGVPRGAALYVGALLGPGLLLLPGLAVTLAGPASILAWAGLLVASGLFAVVFAALGVRNPSAGGVRAYAEAGLGPRAGRAVAWCFLAGVVSGAPIVCVTCGNYVADLLGGDVRLASATAALLLLGTLAVTLRGVRTSATVQFGLVVLLVAIVVGAVAGAAPASRAANWTPFAPHGWTAIGPAASTLMLAFVGWEAIAPLTNRFARPGRQLPVVIGIAFGTTTVIYLALGTVTVAALGPQANTSVPLAALLTLAVGPAGQAIAVVGAVVLTVGAILAYLAGAGSLARSLTPGSATAPTLGSATAPTLGARIGLPGSGPGSDSKRAAAARDAMPPWLLAALVGSGAVLIGLLGAGVVDLATLVNVPTTFFLVVYLGCTAAACRVLTGPLRAVAAVAFVAVVVVLAFSGYALIPAAAVTALAISVRRGRPAAPDERVSGFVAPGDAAVGSRRSDTGGHV